MKFTDKARSYQEYQSIGGKMTKAQFKRLTGFYKLTEGKRK